MATRLRSAWRVLPIIFGVLGALLEIRMAAPFDMPRQHVGAIAHPEQQRPLRTVDVFVHLARRVNDERTWRYVDSLGHRAHLAAAAEAEINFGAMRVAMIGADLAGLPAGDGVVAVFD